MNKPSLAWTIFWIFGMMITMLLVWPVMLNDIVGRLTGKSLKFEWITSMWRCTKVMLIVYLLGGILLWIF